MSQQTQTHLTAIFLINSSELFEPPSPRPLLAFLPIKAVIIQMRGVKCVEGKKVGLAHHTVITVRFSLLTSELWRTFLP